MSSGGRMFTIIVPVYNVGEYVEQCLSSIQNQTYQYLEVFLVDDGSTDNSRQICEKYCEADSRFHLLSQENAGQAAARNYALDYVTGEYIVFIDSDDWVSDRMLEKLAQLVDAEKPDVIAYEMRMCFENGTCKQDTGERKETYDHYAAMREFLGGRKIRTTLCNKAYRSTIFEKLRFPEIRGGEDAAVMPQIIHESSCVVYTPEILYFYRIRTGSTEQRGYSRDRIGKIRERSRKLQVLIVQNYPDLISSVLIKQLRVYYDCIRNIYIYGNSIRYAKEVYQLLQDMRTDMKSGDIVMEDVPEQIRRFMRCRRVFYVLWIIMGIKKRIVGH